ncbi:hypothetical protein BDF22DRAFT_657530 [Syncephalis plumigaleata]|nr:hypothetical protein BDF22DRAFT_657530 [Syncephalis plumigaleata]
MDSGRTLRSFLSVRKRTLNDGQQTKQKEVANELHSLKKTRSESDLSSASTPATVTPTRYSTRTSSLRTKQSTIIDSGRVKTSKVTPVATTKRKPTLKEKSSTPVDRHANDQSVVRSTDSELAIAKDNSDKSSNDTASQESDVAAIALEKSSNVNDKHDNANEDTKKEQEDNANESDDTLVPVVKEKPAVSRQRSIYHKIRASVEEMCRRQFELRHLAQLKTVYPEAYVFESASVVVNGERQPSIIIDIPSTSTSTTTSNTDQLLARDQLTRRRDQLRDRFVNNKRGIALGDEEWHPDFDLHSVAEIELAPLPLPTQVPIAKVRRLQLFGRKKPSTIDEMKNSTKDSLGKRVLPLKDVARRLANSTEDSLISEGEAYELVKRFTETAPRWCALITTGGVAYIRIHRPLDTAQIKEELRQTTTQDTTATSSIY